MQGCWRENWTVTSSGIKQTLLFQAKGKAQDEIEKHMQSLKIISITSFTVTRIRRLSPLQSKLKLPLFSGNTVVPFNYVDSSRPFVGFLTSSAGLVGCRSFFCRQGEN